MDRKALLTATAIGTVAQLAMILAGHFSPVIRDHVFAIGGMLISLLAGGLYARLAREGWGASLAGGALAGGACALIGILVSVALGDTPARNEISMPPMAKTWSLIKGTKWPARIIAS